MAWPRECQSISSLVELFVAQFLKPSGVVKNLSDYITVQTIALYLYDDKVAVAINYPNVRLHFHFNFIGHDRHGITAREKYLQNTNSPVSLTSSLNSRSLALTGRSRENFLLSISTQQKASASVMRGHR